MLCLLNVCYGMCSIASVLLSQRVSDATANVEQTKHSSANIPYTAPQATPLLTTPPPHSPSQWPLAASAAPSSHSPSESPQRRPPAGAARCGYETRRRDAPLRQSRSCPAARLRPLPCHHTSRPKKAAAPHGPGKAINSSGGLVTTS